MSSESFLILRPQLSTHNYLDGAGLRDIVKEYKAVISAWFLCNELTPMAVKQQCITGTDFILESYQQFHHGNSPSNIDYLEWNDLFTSKVYVSGEY